MKSKILQSTAILSIALLGLTACGGKKKAINPPKGEVEIVLPCSENKSDGDFFRAYSFGESKDANVAKKKALQKMAEKQAAGASAKAVSQTGKKVFVKECF